MGGLYILVHKGELSLHIDWMYGHGGVPGILITAEIQNFSFFRKSWDAIAGGRGGVGVKKSL